MTSRPRQYIYLCPVWSHLNTVRWFTFSCCFFIFYYCSFPQLPAAAISSRMVNHMRQKIITWFGTLLDDFSTTAWSSLHHHKVHSSPEKYQCIRQKIKCPFKFISLTLRIHIYIYRSYMCIYSHSHIVSLSQHLNETLVDVQETGRK